MNDNHWTRREAILAAGAASLFPGSLMGEERVMVARTIPSSGETMPILGIGTYDVFDHPSTPDAIAKSQEIVDILLGEGGSVIDTSPMYNRSEKVIGDVIDAGIDRRELFLATKVWIDGQHAGVAQMNRSADLMNADLIDLMQVHNLRDTAAHMATIRDWMEQGRIRYSGLTHYTAGAHDALTREMAEFKPDFIQINYSLGEREAETRVLPLAQDLGIAVLINRPYQAGRLFRAVSGKDLPEFPQDIADSWGQFFLKFIISHPAVTCVIPATSKPHHMVDNLGAGFGNIPDAPMRKRMVDYFASL